MQIAPYEIRVARAEEISALAEIEDAAATLFAGLEIAASIPSGTCAAADLAASQQAGMLWVAVSPDDAPVGFAFTRWIDRPGRRDVHLEELDVHPAHARRGLGAALVGTLVAWARAQGADAVSLSTFRDVPWNAPFYARFGFRALAESALDAPLRELVALEARKGLPVEQRVVMRLGLRGSEDSTGSR